MRRLAVDLIGVDGQEFHELFTDEFAIRALPNEFGLLDRHADMFAVLEGNREG